MSRILMGFMVVVKPLLDGLIRKPAGVPSILKSQGIKGPPSSFLLWDVNKRRWKWSKSSQEGNRPMTHNCSSLVFPHLHKWRQQYGNNICYWFQVQQKEHYEHHSKILATPMWKGSKYKD
ncbi:hypothetical protein Gohar_022356 [Gossypium harknessii]|uniref:Uncharacterized protein n=1 Tax=Gossypium harknessii TaxID=34285 RepID=A0A7J9IH24_9ROSI|nr:hypothetical protein [Gossypium harknessii]